MPHKRPPLRLALLWHLHQPDYTDDETGAPGMPWTRLHALKDYADMAAHLERHPGVRATLNVVPSLVDQLRSLASGAAAPDPFLALARRDPATLDPAERKFVVGHFFSFQRETMASGLRRVAELHALRGGAPAADLGPEIVRRFGDGAIRDLQVLFHLAWSGALLQEEPLLRRLRAKGRGFTEEEKHALLDRHDAFLRDVLPRWRRLRDTGRVEFSVSPYFHPILPLLCDLESAREALPGMAVPHARFRHPEDAALQLAMAVDSYRETFGSAPDGGWPSEGAISEIALRCLRDAGYRWAASDEDVLFGSLGEVLPADAAAAEARRADVLYRPWRHADGPALLFRDHDLSDRIGFVYSGWKAVDAADDFVGRLRHLHATLPPDAGPYTVSVILDGENAWEHYPGHARPFFDALYGALEAEPAVETVTAAEAASGPGSRVLPRVVAGSWIGRNLATWVGHPEKNRAWDLLAEARAAVAKARGAPDPRDPAWRALLAAEGSDWFWWFGDDHWSAYAEEFDAAFRGKLRAAWIAAGATPPAALAEPVRRGRPLGYTPPLGPVRPVLDGRVTDFYEWMGAGRATPAAGAMQAAARIVQEVLFGTDGERLYVRVDTFDKPAAGVLNGGTLRVTSPAEGAEAASLPLRPGPCGSGAAAAALDRVLEVSVPLGSRGKAGREIRFAVEVTAASGAAERVPSEGYLALPPAAEDPAQYDWWV